MNKLLKNLGTVVIPATDENFVAKDKFVVNKGKNASVKISLIGDHFSQWFLGKIEKPKTETVLRYAKLVKSSVDSPILVELGGEEKAEITLGDVYSLMEKQGNRESGILRTNGYANIFYVRDINNALRAVRVFWVGAGWDVDASLIVYSFVWLGGNRVFSCNS